MINIKESLKKSVYLGKVSKKKNFFGGKGFPMCEHTHPPQGFVRFGKTKDEIRVKKDDF